MASALQRIPAPIRRITAFTVLALFVYAVLLAVGTLFLGSAAAPGSVYSLSATVAAGIAAMYLTYLGGYAKLRDLLG